MCGKCDWVWQDESPRNGYLSRVAFAVLSEIVTLYTIQIRSMASSYVYEDSDGGTFWRTDPSGSLFPRPRGPGMLDIIVRFNDVDLFIYKYIFKSWFLAGGVISALDCTLGLDTKSLEDSTHSALILEDGSPYLCAEMDQLGSFRLKGGLESVGKNQGCSPTFFPLRSWR